MVLALSKIWLAHVSSIDAKLFLFYGQSNLFTTRADPKVVEIIREV